MLGALKKICRNTIKLNQNKILHDVLSATQLQYDILNLNREDQLYDKGITADNVSLGGYARETLYYKQNEAGKIGRDTKTANVTLKDSGEFYATFKFSNENDGFVISANAEIHGESLLRYGKIIGLTPQNKAVVAGWVTPLVIKNTKQAILK